MLKHPDGNLDRKAGLGARFAAWFIDSIIISIVLFFLIFVFVLGILGAASAESGGLVAGLSVFMYLVIFVVMYGYYIVMEAVYGQTLGKKALNIVVKTEDGGPIGWGESAIRNILRIIDIIPALYLLGAILVWATDDQQRLGDIAASTVVVETK